MVKLLRGKNKNRALNDSNSSEPRGEDLRGQNQAQSKWMWPPGPCFIPDLHAVTAIGVYSYRYRYDDQTG